MKSRIIVALCVYISLLIAIHNLAKKPADWDSLPAACPDTSLSCSRIGPPSNYRYEFSSKWPIFNTSSLDASEDKVKSLVASTEEWISRLPGIILRHESTENFSFILVNTATWFWGMPMNLGIQFNYNSSHVWTSALCEFRFGKEDYETNQLVISDFLKFSRQKI